MSNNVVDPFNAINLKRPNSTVLLYAVIIIHSLLYKHEHTKLKKICL